MRNLGATVGLLLLAGCAGFEPLPDSRLDRDSTSAEGPIGPADLDSIDVQPTDLGVEGIEPDGCPGGPPRPPTIEAFEVTDAVDHVVLDQPVSLVVTARPALVGAPLSYSFGVLPAADPVQDNGDGTARWALTTADPVFFTTPFEITVAVTHACGGPSATASVTVTVLGNVLVADMEHAAIEALGSNGKMLGQLVGPAALTAPEDMVLLGQGELAVTDLSAKLVKVIDLGSGQVVRSFGGSIENLQPEFIERAADGGVLVGPAGNRIAHFDPQGQLVSLLEAPHPYTIAGLTRRGDGTIIVGTSGVGRLYAFSPTGQSLGLWAEIPSTGDTNSLLALASGEVIAGLRDNMNDGLLARLSSSGAVLETIPSSVTHYYLRRFADGYLSVRLKSNKIYRLDAQLGLAAAPFATLSTDAWVRGMVWLHQPP